MRDMGSRFEGRVISDPKINAGRWTFKGTNVRYDPLENWLERGGTVDDYLADPWHCGVSRDAVEYCAAQWHDRQAQIAESQARVRDRQAYAAAGIGEQLELDIAQICN